MTEIFPQHIVDLSRQVLAEARARHLKIGTAESCTGGLVAGALTDIPGSSDVFERGFSTYSYEAKKDVLGVSSELLVQFGAVSTECARAMAEGVIAVAPVQVSVAITGIAGPDGGSREKPTGLVHFAAASLNGPTVTIEKRFGEIGRGSVRMASVETALGLLLKVIRSA